MKNIHVLPTDKPSRLYQLKNDILRLDYKIDRGEANKHIYITNSEEIKEGDWFLDRLNQLCLTDKDILKVDIKIRNKWYKKIILTTDQELINCFCKCCGVQTIDDDFLEWFVKNPSCEVVEVIKEDIEQPKPLYSNGNHKGERVWIETYKIIIPKEEPCDNCNNDICCCIIKEEHKQETLEEAAEKQWGNVHRTGVLGFIDGAKWQAERMYNEEDLISFAHFYFKKEFNSTMQTSKSTAETLKEWFEQNKKK